MGGKQGRSEQDWEQADSRKQANGRDRSKQGRSKSDLGKLEDVLLAVYDLEAASR